MRWKRASLALLSAALISLAAPIYATMMLQLDLQQLTTRADKIFRGTVIHIDESTVSAGGGQLPTVTYRLRVDELFKGAPTQAKEDAAVIEIRMVGTLLPPKADENGMIHLSTFRDVPRLKMDGDYVLFTTAQSAIGLSTTVGLGQGAFSVLLSESAEAMAVNEFNNAGLGLDADGPVAYDKFSAQIRALLNQ